MSKFNKGDKVININTNEHGVIIVVHEMRRRGKDSVNRRKVGRDELGHVLETVTLDEHEKVVAARHQKARLDLLELGNALGYLSKATVPLRRYP